MIISIDRINSLGKFRNYNATANVEFKKLTLVYADNGSGKTTLTAMLRSLKDNDSSIIQNRISTNPTADQSIQITLLNVNTPNRVVCSYNQQQWSHHVDGIEIFDNCFIHQNIFSGFTFSEEQKRNLHEFVLGSSGVALKAHIEQNKLERSTIGQDNQSIEIQIIGLVGSGLTRSTIASYISINPNEIADIENRITLASLALESAKQNSAISRFDILKPLSHVELSINLYEVKADLAQNIDTIQDQALQDIFTSHCDELHSASLVNAEQWLREGYEYFKHKSINFNQTQGDNNFIGCPFCRQNIDGTLSIIRAYTLRFNEIFNRYIERLRGYLNTFDLFHIDQIFLSLKVICEENNRLLSIWSNYIPTLTNVNYEQQITAESDLVTNYAALKNEILSKVNNPSPVGNTASIDNFIHYLEGINAFITEYNDNINIVNTRIIGFKRGITSEQTAQDELNSLNRVRLRSNDNVQVLCTQYTNNKNRIRELENEYSGLVLQQEVESNHFFSLYQERINYYLDNIFRTPIRIEQVIHVT